MAVKQLEDLFDIGVDILGSDVSSNGTISYQTGDVVTQQVTGANCEAWQHVGFASRPAKADPGKAACQAVTINRGAGDCAIASKDIRGQQIYGNLNAGESCFYAPGAQGRVVCKSDGSVTVFTTDDNTNNGNGVYFRVAPNMFQMVAPWGTFTFDATGVHYNTASGVTFDMGALSAPAPLDSVMPNYCRIGTQSFSVDSPSCFLGPSTGVFGSVVNTIAPVPLTPVLCSAPGSPTVPPMTGSAGVFVSIG